MFSKKTFLFILLLAFLLLAEPTLAAETEGGGSGGLFVNASRPDLRELGTVIVRVINFLLGIAGSAAIIMIVVGGFRYIVASGDPKATQSAKHTLTFAILGLVVILLAVVIVQFVGNILGAENLNFIRIGT